MQRIHVSMGLSSMSSCKPLLNLSFASSSASASSSSSSKKAAGGGGGGLQHAIHICRPSKRNRSPYVADVELLEGPPGLGGLREKREAIAHVPNLDNGGKCVPGAHLLVRRQPGVTPNTLGPHGTPKCEVICQLVRVKEPPATHDEPGWHEGEDGGVWVNAHPRIGEQLAQSLMERGTLDESLSIQVQKDTTHVFEQVTLTAASGEVFRPDFVVADDDANSITVVEVKQVVDTDVAPEHAEALAVQRSPAPVFVSPHGGKDGRSGIFPWGGSNQTGPDGEKVVSARAIKHVDLLSKLASSKPDKSKAKARKTPWTQAEAAEAANRAVAGKQSHGAARVSAAVVFIVGRADVTCMRPNGAACPSFARHLENARKNGVKAIARRIVWDNDGAAYDGGDLPILDALEANAKLSAPKQAATSPKKKQVKAQAAASPEKKQAKAHPQPQVETPPAKRTRSRTRVPTV